MFRLLLCQLISILQYRSLADKYLFKKLPTAKVAKIYLFQIEKTT